MKNIFICAPYRATAVTDIHHNIVIAKAAAVTVASLGHYPVCPHLNTGFFEVHPKLKHIKDDQWLEGAMNMLRCCEAIYVVTGNRRTAGMIPEIVRAIETGVTVLTTLEELENY